MSCTYYYFFMMCYRLNYFPHFIYSFYSQNIIKIYQEGPFKSERAQYHDAYKDPGVVFNPRFPKKRRSTPVGAKVMGSKNLVRNLKWSSQNRIQPVKALLVSHHKTVKLRGGQPGGSPGVFF